MADDYPLPPQLEAIAKICRGDPRAIVETVRSLVEEHGRWNDYSLNLVASHNHLSPTARALLSSAVADNIMSGHVGARDHAGGAWIDAIDTIVVELCKKLFGSQWVEYRPMSGALANGLALFGLLAPGETVMALPAKFGGHRTYREDGYAGALRVNVLDLPYDDATNEIDLPGLAVAVERLRPRLIIVGTAELRFPYPVKELKVIADSVSASVVYDGAHVLGLVAGGQFQDPLGEGAAVLTGSTQKTLAGPIGGLIMTRDEDLGKQISCHTSGLISNYHNNRIAALAVTLAEMVCFGQEYATQVIHNAQALARALDERGLPVVGKDRGFTRSHIVLLDVTALSQGEVSFQLLEEARIPTTRVPLPHTYPERRGIRLGTSAVTRRGMKVGEMATVAHLIRRVLIDREPPERVARDVKELVAAYSSVRYCFGES
jgi:glycine hydroxymethyltransferase